MEKIYLTVNEAAKLLSIGKNQVYELLYEPDFPATKIGRNYKIPRLGLEEWANERARLKLGFEVTNIDNAYIKKQIELARRGG